MAETASDVLYKQRQSESDTVFEAAFLKIATDVLRNVNPASLQRISSQFDFASILGKTGPVVIPAYEADELDLVAADTYLDQAYMQWEPLLIEGVEPVREHLVRGWVRLLAINGGNLFSTLPQDIPQSPLVHSMEAISLESCGIPAILVKREVLESGRKVIPVTLQQIDAERLRVRSELAARNLTIEEYRIKLKAELAHIQDTPIFPVEPT